MTPSVSVIVVSRQRPKSLRRLLAFLRHQTFRRFEVVVVADHTPETRPDLGYPLSTELFSEANISKARNIGLDRAKGSLIAFCDDDAVPEPTWLDHLVLPFQSSKVASAGGFVTGRNGVALQTGAVLFDRHGLDRHVPLTSKDTVVIGPMSGGTLKTVGTNCAFRAKTLAQIGGFDETYRYFLDETDVNMRLAKAGWMSASVPMARVQHFTESGPDRSSRRVPSSLFEVGASHGYFLKTHAPTSDLHQLRAQIRRDHARKLMKLFQLGLLNGPEKQDLLTSFEQGFAEGQERPSGVRQGFQAPTEPVEFLEPTTAPLLVQSHSQSKVFDLIAEGKSVTVLKVERRFRGTRQSVLDEGAWIQHLGYIPAESHQKILLRKTSRISHETARLDGVRWSKGSIPLVHR